MSSADAIDVARTDDPTGALGTFSEDEDLFGIVQVYGRIFDDEATASGFLDGFVQTVAGCSGYQLSGDDGTVTYQAVALHVGGVRDRPAGMRAVLFSEDVGGVGHARRRHDVPPAQERRDRDLLRALPSSTMTTDDVTDLAATIAGRLATL